MKTVKELILEIIDSTLPDYQKINYIQDVCLMDELPLITNKDQLIQSENYKLHESETLLNIQYHIINPNHYDIDIDNMVICNESGLFGVTHGNFIECWFDYLEVNRHNIPDYFYDKIFNEIKKVEEYHLDHFTYNNII